MPVPVAVAGRPATSTKFPLPPEHEQAAESMGYDNPLRFPLISSKIHKIIAKTTRTHPFQQSVKSTMRASEKDGGDPGGEKDDENRARQCPRASEGARQHMADEPQ